eukprot:TRINITY_DN21362_c0_g1_i1.p1 TRINITY_DN21362_c0_g1~~TRINITY_DN21362_c0_g1_i1.p1  ORF type:complete len:1052 (-),score=147.27 TRINITY_DN21362_c0_g1_i1:154-3261(-)
MTTFSACFERVATEVPHDVALVEQATGRHATYAELGRDVQLLASCLRTAACEGDVVALYMERSIAFEAAKLACSQLAMVALPLAMDYPVTRLSQIVSLAGARALLYHSRHAINPDVLTMDPALKCINVHECAVVDAGSPLGVANPGRSGILLSSSGSTGKPKLILRKDSSFFHRLNWTWTNLPFDKSECCMQKSHATTTHHIYETMEPLLKGIRVHILPEISKFGVESIMPYMREHRISRILAVPTLMRALMQDSFPVDDQIITTLKVIVLMGEAPPKDVCMRAVSRFPQTRIFTIYGSTEASSSMALEITDSVNSMESYPLGEPLHPDIKALVLDENQKEVGVGETGTLHFAGPHLMSQYVGLEAETREKLYQSEDLLLYNTCDAVFRGTSGALIHKGRTDSVVKLRGFRVDLQEVDSELRRASAFADAASVMLEGDAASIVSFVTPLRVDVEGGAVQEVSNLRAALGKTLPAYMLPKRIVPLPSLPLAANGKVDRRALTDLASLLVGASPAPESGGAAAKLGASVEKSGGRNGIAVVCQAVIETTGAAASADDNIMHVGVDSLNLRIFAQKLRAAAPEVPIPDRLLLSNPTVGELARLLDDDAADAKQDRSDGISMDMKPTYGIRTFMAMWIVRNHTRFFWPGSLADTAYSDGVAQFRVVTFVMLAAMGASMKFDLKKSRLPLLPRLMQTMGSILPIYWICSLMSVPCIYMPCAKEPAATVGLIMEFLMLFGWSLTLPIQGVTWFLTALLTFYVAFNVLQECVQRYCRVATLNGFLCSLFVLQSITILVRAVLFVTTGGALALVHFWALPHIPQFMLGMAAGQAVLHLPLDARAAKRVAWATDATAIVAAIIVLVPWTPRLVGLVSSAMYVLCDAFVAFVMFGMVRTSTWTGAFFSFSAFVAFSPYTFAMYMVHVPVLNWVRFAAHNPDFDGFGDVFTYDYANTACAFQWTGPKQTDQFDLFGVIPALCWNGQCASENNLQVDPPAFAHANIFAWSVVLSLILTAVVHEPLQRMFNWWYKGSRNKTVVQAIGS